MNRYSSMNIVPVILGSKVTLALPKKQGTRFLGNLLYLYYES